MAFGDQPVAVLREPALVRCEDGGEVCVLGALALGEAGTERLGRAFAAIAPKLRVAWLEGDLGAGKTAFARFALRALGARGSIKSPTYTICETYDTSAGAVAHMDLYRFEDPSEWEDAGLDDETSRCALTLIEWPDKGAGFVAHPDARVVLARPTAQDLRLALGDADSQAAVGFGAGADDLRAATFFFADPEAAREFRGRWG